MTHDGEARVRALTETAAAETATEAGATPGADTDIDATAPEGDAHDDA